MLSNALSTAGDSTVFMGENDPELIGDALPVVMKVYEALLDQDPENDELLRATGTAFIMYANAFVQTPAEMLPDNEFKSRLEMMKRAKNLYIRGRNYLLDAIEIRYSGFIDSIDADAEILAEALSRMTTDDVPLLYWCAAGWVAAFPLDTLDFELSLSIPQAHQIMNRALELDETFSNGTIHEFFISFHASMPSALGGDESRVMHHYEEALAISEGKMASTYYTLATSYAVKRQDADQYRELLEMALAVDPDAFPENRLINIITQRKARWRLDHIGDFFLIDMDADH